ncbi:MAG: ABC transporter substrate-binding protein/permease [Fusobacterium perfoetens]|uniref:ABC transporter substrate-binding protein/permease n=1 Tax=Fusobacterium perfoetens TaxID=852 RepID=UPI0023F00EDC|nr:ABC transporter substrate-binding protein/permease [Fusobacterium perfoetens]MCI6152758.1 ABC transporter substrate-binding protein/permease [Fusobacterium perfoetens]MDY3236652.1 ABC transporter substrate-binding protein/permease [Fusobacterium perfoetens]
MNELLKKQILKFLVMLIVFVGFFTNTIAENKKAFEGKHFVMATSANFPPLEYVTLDENGQNKVVGFDVDLATALSEELGFTYEIMNTQFSSLIGGLQSKRVDFIISGMSPTEERKKSVDFTNGYFFPKIAIISLKGDKEYPTLKSLEGKKIATTFGTNYEKIAQGVKGAELVSLENSVIAVQEVLSGRVEGAIVDERHAVEFVKEQPKLTYHILSEKESPASNSSFAIACQKNSPLTEEFNKALVTLKENGKLSEIAKKWLGEEGESFITNPKAKPLSGKHLIMAVNATFPPFESVELNEDGKEEIIGFDMDIAKLLSEKLGFTYEVNNMEFSGLVGALQSKRADFVLSGISPTEERKESIDFTKDYFYPKTAIICLKDKNLYSLKKLEGKKIATTFGTNYANIAERVKDGKVTLLNSSPLVMQELLNERVDAAIIDASQASEFMKKYNNLEFHVLSESEVKSTDSYAIGCQKGSELVEIFNKALTELEESGEIEKLVVKWMGEEFTKVNESSKIDEVSDNNEIKDEGLKLHFGRVLEYKKLFVNGLVISLKFTLLSAVAGIVLGTILALVKVSKIKPLQIFANVYTSVFRGTPLLVQLFLVYFATPQLIGYKIPTLNAAVITFGLNSAAYVSEILRGGIQSIDRGQYEAAMALGVPYYKMMKDIVIPQAVKVVLPGLVNEMIALLKESSLVSTIGVVDMMRASQTVMNVTYLAFEPFIIVALMYYVLVMILTSFANVLEGRLRKNDRN